ncbi:hypothetical protein GGH91_004535 [Coemansia sp. RSA 2671]|nr:hypothetical protein GGH91_004535 [Coemansia sp. RSA 2671]
MTQHHHRRLNQQGSQSQSIPLASRLPEWMSARSGASLAIRVTLATAALATVFVSSAVLYGMFYKLYVPKLLHEATVHLQYDSPTNTTAYIGFVQKPNYRFLSTSQAYTVTLDLHVPTSEYNEKLGNFMISLGMLDAQAGVVYQASRAAILPFRSTAVRYLQTMLRAIPLALGLSQESRVLSVVLADDLYDRLYSPIVAARLVLSQPVQVYSATLTVAARFEGLRYWMYYWRSPVAGLFISLAAMWQVVLMGIAWSVLEAYTTRSSATVRNSPAASTPQQPTTSEDAATLATSTAAAVDDRSHIEMAD